MGSCLYTSDSFFTLFSEAAKMTMKWLVSWYDGDEEDGLSRGTLHTTELLAWSLSNSSSMGAANIPRKINSAPCGAVVYFMKKKKKASVFCSGHRVE